MDKKTFNELFKLRAALAALKKDHKRALSALARTDIQFIGTRGELLAYKRDFAELKAAAAACVDPGDPLSCGVCDSPTVERLRAVLKKIC